MYIQFHKLQGTGNDFVLLDNRDGRYNGISGEQVAKICHRRFGIGADGLMLLQNHTSCDFEMVYFNADGNPSSMCGNGGRCIVAFALHLGLISSHTRFLAVDGMHEAHINGIFPAYNVKLHMNDVAKIDTYGKDLTLDTGSPHYVQVLNEVEQANVFEKGMEIRYSPDFKQKGINVNFIEPLSQDTIFVRTYERGVEAETWSCGTGVTAAVLAASKMKLINGNVVNVHTLGGKLKVHFMSDGESYKDVYLEGPAMFVFEGGMNV